MASVLKGLSSSARSLLAGGDGQILKLRIAEHSLHGVLLFVVKPYIFLAETIRVWQDQGMGWRCCLAQLWFCLKEMAPFQPKRPNAFGP